MRTQQLRVWGALTLFGLLSIMGVSAQDGIIKVVSTLHPDGSRTDMQTDASEGTGESKTYNSAGKLVQRVTYKLDDMARPAEGVVYSAKGAFLYRFVYTRDNSGRILEERDTDAKGNLVRRVLYRYDANGKVSGLDAYDGQGKPLMAPGKSSGTKANKKPTPSPTGR